MPLKLERNGLAAKRDNGCLEHGVVAIDEAGKAVHLVFLSVSPTGHVSVIDPHEHPGYHPHYSPGDHVQMVKAFLALDGHKMLGHPTDYAGVGAKAEVERLCGKYGIVLEMKPTVDEPADV